jgi:hypothetical protein
MSRLLCLFGMLCLLGTIIAAGVAGLVVVARGFLQYDWILFVLGWCLLGFALALAHAARYINFEERR